jgi:hypothetical protein
MTNFKEYTQLTMGSNLSKQIEDLSEFGLFVYRDNKCDGTILLDLYGQIGVSAPSKDALIALETIETEHDVLPSHTLSIPGGELHIYTRPDEIDITPLIGDELNWQSTDLSIYDASQSMRLASCPRLFRIMPEWEECIPSQEFVDDIKAFNKGRLIITAHAEIKGNASSTPL